MSEPTIEEMRDEVLAVYPNAYRRKGEIFWHVWLSERHHLNWLIAERGVKAKEAQGFLGYDWVDAYSRLPEKAAPSSTTVTGHGVYTVTDTQVVEATEAAPDLEEGKADIYELKPIAPVKAVRWNGSNWAEVHSVYPGLGEEYMRNRGCREGDWVISPHPGRVDFMTDATFSDLYKKVAPDSEAFERAWKDYSGGLSAMDKHDKRRFRDGWYARARLDAERGKS